MINILIFLIFQSSLFAQTTYKTVVAEYGDGVYSILRRNSIPASYAKKFIELNADKIDANYNLKVGKTYRLPIVKGEIKEEILIENDVIEPRESEKSIINKIGETLDAIGVNEKSSSKNAQKESSKKEKTTTNLSSTTRKYSIFGSDYENVPIESKLLKGAVIYLASGHGGPDPGAVAHYNGKLLCEDEYAYDITLRLARILISNGATVFMIIQDPNDGIRNGWYLAPDRDEVCYPDNIIPPSQLFRLRQQSDAVNRLYPNYKGKYQRVIIIHVDSRSEGKNIDVFFYYDSKSAKGAKFATNIRNTFEYKYKKFQPGRGYNGSVSERNLYVLKNTSPVGTFIEMGNINHKRDVQRLIVEENRQLLAKWLYEGILLDYQNNR